MSSKEIVVRQCFGCKNMTPGVQKTKDKNWHVFYCEPCDEEWGENIAYYCEQNYHELYGEEAPQTQLKAA